MLKISKSIASDKNELLLCNYSDDELTFKHLFLKCQALESEKIKKLKLRKELLVLNERNENVTKSLLKLKKDFELYKSDLSKTLCNMRMASDKQKILTQKKLDEFFKKSQKFQEYSNIMLPMQYELENLVRKNKDLQEEWDSKTELLKLTKSQYVGLMCFIMETFQKKVCEFCNLVLRSYQ